MGDFSVVHGEDKVPSLFINPPSLYIFKNAGTLTMASRVDASPNGVETPTIFAYR